MMTWRQDRAIVCLFCEDIRQEIGGQTSLIGIFPPDTFAPQVPIVIPKLGLYMVIRFPFDQVPISVRMRLMAPWSQEPLWDVPMEGIKESAEIAQSHGYSAFGVSSFHMLSPFPVLETGIIRVLATIDGEDISAGAINITVPPTNPSPQPAP